MITARCAILVLVASLLSLVVGSVFWKLSADLTRVKLIWRFYKLALHQGLLLDAVVLN